jgi:enolase
MKITKITPRMILDSRGYPTVEVDITLNDTYVGRASVPSGASTGSHEALELRDGDESKYGGKGVSKALENISNHLAKELIGKEFATQREFDSLLCNLDGTKNKSKFGANAILGLSLSYAKAVAKSRDQEFFEYIRSEYVFTKPVSLPMPLVNILNGGKHAKSSTDVQEWMIVPVGAKTFEEAIQMGTKVFYTLRSIMEKLGTSSVGDEGGFPLAHVSNNKEALLILMDAVKSSGYVPGKDIAFALDVAASEFFSDGVYTLSSDHSILDSSQMISWLSELASQFPIISIEDGLSEDDWESWKNLTDKIGNKVQLVGDDLFVTNTDFIKKGLEMGVANAVLIKLNQIGTLSETADAILLAHSKNYQTIISHRSGETEDTTIAHLSVASGSGQIKTGSFSRTERLAKYNELLRIGEKVSAFNNPFQ